MNHFGCDVALLSVTDTEYGAVLHFHDWEAFRVPGDDQRYERASFFRDGREHTLIHARTGEMGMTAASTAAAKIIYTFRPRYLIMVGIAAGIALTEVAEQIYGDVIVPDVVWNYAVGKFVSPDAAFITYGDVGFLPRSTSVAVPESPNSSSAEWPTFARRFWLSSLAEVSPASSRPYFDCVFISRLPRIVMP